MNLINKIYSLILVLTTLWIKENSSQEIIFAGKHIAIYSTWNITDESKIENTLNRIVLEIKTKCESTRLEQKGEIYISHIESLRKDWRNDLFLLLTREKRGLRFLGELFADLTDTASPDDFDRLQRVTKDLVEVTNNEEIQIKYLKTKLEKTTNALTNYIQETNELNLNLSKILQNQILINKNSTELGTHLDILHTQAMTIISHANNEVEQIKEILNKAEFHLPSKYMFNPETIRNIIKESAENDKVFSHLFFTKTEINDLYHFESTVTAYKKDTNQLIAMLHLPLADFSHKMTTYKLPKMDIEDLNKIHALEDITKKKYNRLQCSKYQNSFRLIDTNDLTKCQKNRIRNIFLCSGRELTLKMNHIIDCNITKLPKTLAAEIDDNNIVIQSSEDKISVFCRNTQTTIIFPSQCPTQIYIPDNCFIKSRSLHLKAINNSDNIRNISHQTDKIKLFPIKIKAWKPFTQIQPSKQNASIHENDNKLENELQRKVDTLLKKTKNDVKELTKTHHTEISITAITIAGLTLFTTIAITCYLNRIKKPIGNHKCEVVTSENKVELLELKTEIREIESKICKEIIDKIWEQLDSKNQETVAKILADKAKK